MYREGDKAGLWGYHVSGVVVVGILVCMCVKCVSSLGVSWSSEDG